MPDKVNVQSITVIAGNEKYAKSRAIYVFKREHGANLLIKKVQLAGINRNGNGMDTYTYAISYTNHKVNEEVIPEGSE